MKIQSPKKSWKKRTIIASSVLLVVVSGLTAFAYYTESWPFEHSSDGSTKPSPKEQAKIDKETAIKDKEKTQASSPNVDASQSTDQVPISTTAAVEIVDLHQSNGSVVYSATISNSGSSGTCSAVFSNNANAAQPVTRTIASSGSSCGPVSIPEVEFSAIGQWTLTLRYYTGDAQAVATKTIEVK